MGHQLAGRSDRLVVALVNVDAPFYPRGPRRPSEGVRISARVLWENSQSHPTFGVSSLPTRLNVPGLPSPPRLENWTSQALASWATVLSMGRGTGPLCER